MGDEALVPFLSVSSASQIWGFSVLVMVIRIFMRIIRLEGKSGEG